MNTCCGCCTGTAVTVPAPETNLPGLAALSYRVGTYAGFFDTMLAQLSQVPIHVPSAGQSGTDQLTPLTKLTTRDPSDPSIALLDAWAVVGDVLTFYQERIANEGFLPTAIERRSLIELARLIGYRPRSGVAASVRLAFTVSAGFSGVLPAGTRAQSVPSGSSATPQFYETSADLATRDTWNALAPRLSRPQVITPASATALPPAANGSSSTALSNGNAAGVSLPPDSGILVTGADVIDAVYLCGISTLVKPGDALFFIFGSDTAATPAMQYLRMAADVDVQAAFSRTEITLGLVVPPTRSAFRQLLLYIDKGTQLFAGSDLAAQVVAILQPVAANLLFVGATGPDGKTLLTAKQVVEPAMSRIAVIRGIALTRGFTRVSAWLTMLIRSLQWIALGQDAQLLPGGIADAIGILGRKVGKISALQALPAAAPASPLENLHSIVSALAKAPSVQPANALKLPRSIATSFGPQSDTAPRLLAALLPAAAGTLYEGWAAVATAAGRVEVYAARVKAALFAASWPGSPVTTTGNTVTTTYSEPNLASAWGNAFSTLIPLPELPLDAAYDQIKPGSWVAVRRPDVVDTNSGNPIITFHIVAAVRTANLSTQAPHAAASLTGGGFAAKVTLLTLDPPWLSDMTTANQTTAQTSTQLLRETLVYAQAEALSLTDEPLDTDVENGSIDLANLYDGLEAGRWVIVSGTRTDIPNASGVQASELAMIAGVRQGVEAPGSVAFPLGAPPFVDVSYTSDADAWGDRLVVGHLPPGTTANKDGSPAFMTDIAAPAFLNQQFQDQVQIAPGVYVSAYVPDADGRVGSFPSFDGMLVDPQTQVPYPGGALDWQKDGVFAWRISTVTPHTVLDLAAPLASTYDRSTVTIYGNVADATQGQSTGEVLGNADASINFQTFALSQSPLTYVSALGASGIASTLQVRVNELLWNEVDSLSDAAPAQRAYVTSEDDTQTTTVAFGNGVHGARPPSGTANVKAAYRYGMGSDGNLDAWQITQLATHPLGAQGVTNPLPASGGADADPIDQLRANAPMAVMALDRLVSVQDYADFARTYAGIGKASSVKLSDGQRELVHVTVAGADDIPIDVNSDLYANLLASLRDCGDPHLPVELAVRRVRLIVMAAQVALLAEYAWEDVEPALRAAVLACFGFDARALGQTAYLAEAVATLQQVEGVSWVDVTCFDSVPEDVTAAHLAALGSTLGLYPFVEAQFAQRAPGSADLSSAILPAELVFITPDIPATLILNPSNA
ncbi:putative baseplate assembly protein [Paraburkholderia guartelaensis]|uniref:putative baseplate assembly protein n=1 Tax=Paraburkholderia guartelaensis TaxID=2546446 RepID=UPI002AB6FABB|nr:putative baseplate assembly protein [Paraburkholderia guartelaensis]